MSSCSRLHLGMCSLSLLDDLPRMVGRNFRLRC